MAEQNGGGATDPAGLASENDGGDGGALPGGVGAADPSQYVRTGRGRHPNDCPCERCLAKRSGASITSSAGRTSAGKISAKDKGLDLEGFALQIVGVHKLAAMFFKNELFAISNDEAKKLAHATKNVLALHNLNVSPSTLAYLQLIGVCIAIYGPRFAIYQQMAKLEKAKRDEENRIAKATPANVQASMAEGTATIQ